jgi:glutamate-1-semialdehyde aminotransferase
MTKEQKIQHENPHTPTKMFWERSRDVIAQGTLTYSKRDDQFIKGVYPTHILELPAQMEDFFIGIDGKKYLDFSGGLGAVNYSIENLSTLPHVKEVIVAEKLKERIPLLEKMRFLKTGSEACLAAVRIARAYNLKYRVYGVGYHGWGDMFLHAEKENKGTIDNSYRRFNSLLELSEALENTSFEVANAKTPESIAAVIIEPVMLDLDVESILERIRAECDRLKIVLIYDEVITGFRFPNFCVANYFRPKPDLLILGKTIANGYPLSVIGGKAELMDNENYFVSSTFAGDHISLMNAETVIDSSTKENLEKLWNNGKKFMTEFNRINDSVQLHGYPTRAEWHGDLKYVFWQEMCKKGYILGRAFFYNNYIEQYTVHFLKLSKAVISDIVNNKITLESEEPKPVFRRNH